jgi:hypothetical protein
MVVNQDINSLLSQELSWTKSSKIAEWEVNVDGRIYKLRMNDFPAEPMYTLSIGSKSIDFDDKPELWLIPRM